VALRSTAIHSDSDSYLVGVDGHASFCMANHPDQFDGDLQMIEGGHKVTGIGSGIAIKGMGTFKFQIKDDIGQVHTIRVPNSLYVPSLKRVLFAPITGPKKQKTITQSRMVPGWPLLMTVLYSNGTNARQ
jgi:hypothetical protein